MDGNGWRERRCFGLQVWVAGDAINNGRSVVYKSDQGCGNIVVVGWVFCASD